VNFEATGPERHSPKVAHQQEKKVSQSLVADIKIETGRYARATLVAASSLIPMRPSHLCDEDRGSDISLVKLTISPKRTRDQFRKGKLRFAAEMNRGRRFTNHVEPDLDSMPFSIRATISKTRSTSSGRESWAATRIIRNHPKTVSE
jgi:hypothetical protein